MSDTYHTIVAQSLPIGPASPESDPVPTREEQWGDNSSDWLKGQLVIRTSGVIVEALTNAVAQILDTDDIADGATLFIATEALGTATDGNVKVKRVLTSTIFEGPLVSSLAAQATPPTAPQSIVGTDYALWQDTNGRFAVDKNNESNPLVTITEVEASFLPYKDASLYLHSAADAQQYNFVRFKFKAASFALNDL